MRRLLYVSMAAHGFGPGDCQGVLNSAARRNNELDITGILLMKGRLLLQYLEGPAWAVGSLYEDAICRDARHCEPTALLDVHDARCARLFGGWRMGFFHVSIGEPALGFAALGKPEGEVAQALRAADKGDLFAELMRSFLHLHTRSPWRRISQFDSEAGALSA